MIGLSKFLFNTDSFWSHISWWKYFNANCLKVSKSNLINKTIRCFRYMNIFFYFHRRCHAGKSLCEASDVMWNPYWIPLLLFQHWKTWYMLPLHITKCWKRWKYHENTQSCFASLPKLCTKRDTKENAKKMTVLNFQKQYMSLTLSSQFTF